MMYITAYGALIQIAKLAAGDTVLIPAASSSVGIAAIQVANMVGATPVALTRTSAKREQLQQAGARHVIATEEQDLVAEVQRDRERIQSAPRGWEALVRDKVRLAQEAEVRRLEAGRRG